MNTCRIGFFTAEAIGVKWFSLAVVRDRNCNFYSVEVLPDNQAFAESSTIKSCFELPKTDFIKKRQYGELEDGTYISAIGDKELTNATNVNISLIHTRIDQPEWQFIERQISLYFRSHKFAFVNGTIATLNLINGKTVRFLIETTIKQPKFYVFAPATKINYIQSKNTNNVYAFPTFVHTASILKKYISYSMYNAAEAPKGLFNLQVTKMNQQPTTEKFNPHPKGCIICGAEGSGRSFLTQYIADEMNLRFLVIDADPFMSYQITFPELSQEITPKTIVHLKNFDQHFSGDQTPFEIRLISQLLALIDDSKQVFFVMTAISKDSLPNSLLTSKRLGFNIVIPPLSTKDIQFIIGSKFSQEIIDTALGSTTAQLIAAAETGDQSELYDSLQSEGVIKGSVSQTNWEDIGGLSETKKAVREAVEWPLTRTKDLNNFGIKPPRGVLLHGPPGCGKTMIARAIATSLSSSFFSISAASVFQMYLGESERVIRDLFALARQKAPAVIFIDEIDAMVGKRGQFTGVSERVLSTFLNEMDGVTTLQDVVVVAATNRLKALDEALCRPGRFDCIIEVLPSQTIQDIAEILQICTKKMPIEDNVIEEISQIIPLGTSGAEIDNFCREAALLALHDGSEKISCKHFYNIMNKHRL